MILYKIQKKRVDNASDAGNIMRQQISRGDTNMQRQQHSEHTDRRITEKNQVTISFDE